MLLGSSSGLRRATNARARSRRVTGNTASSRLEFTSPRLRFGCGLRGARVQRRVVFQDLALKLL